MGISRRTILKLASVARVNKNFRCFCCLRPRIGNSAMR